MPIPDDVHALLRERLRVLSAEARDALLVAAASATPTADLVEAVQGSDLALEEAASAGIVTMRGSAVEFTHPLFASAVYADAAPSTRRGVHERLAAVSTDLEQRARHLAMSSPGHNEDVASSLEGAAVQARARGAPDAAAELSELAVRATPPMISFRVSGGCRCRPATCSMRATLLELERSSKRCSPCSNPGRVAPRLCSCFLRSPGRILRRVSSLLQQALSEAGEEAPTVADPLRSGVGGPGHGRARRCVPNGLRPP